MAVAWGLEQTRYFTQGCDNLLVITDHKPLVKLLGDRTLDEITNSRLFRLKQRTLPWRFEIQHLPGKSNHAADATSRHPSPSGSNTAHVPDLLEIALMASVRQDTQELGTLSWHLIAQETAKDASLSSLLQMIEKGKVPDEQDASTAPFWPIRHSLYAEDGVLLFQDRVVIPRSLRPRVLQHLHAAHQGTSSMEQRGRAIAYWPGMTRDIRETRDRCADCNKNAPSQAATLPLPSPPPSTPFEEIFAGFFDYGAAITSSPGIASPAGWKSSAPRQTPTSQEPLVSYNTSAPSSESLACRWSSPAMVARRSRPATARTSSMGYPPPLLVRVLSAVE